VTAGPMEREPDTRLLVTMLPVASTSPAPENIQGRLSSYMGEDELFRDPFADGFPSRR
jgi:hypothetical protein